MSCPSLSHVENRIKGSRILAAADHTLLVAPSLRVPWAFLRFSGFFPLLTWNSPGVHGHLQKYQIPWVLGWGQKCWWRSLSVCLSGSDAFPLLSPFWLKCTEPALTFLRSSREAPYYCLLLFSLFPPFLHCWVHTL